MVVSNICALRSKADAAFGITNGALLMLSTPQAIMSAASPQAMVRALSIIACKPLAQSLFTVVAATSTDKPARREAIRATLRLSSPLWLAAPAITSSMAFGSTCLLRSINDFITWASRSSGLVADSKPAYFPMGVRTESIT